MTPYWPRRKHLLRQEQWFRCTFGSKEATSMPKVLGLGGRYEKLAWRAITEAEGFDGSLEDFYHGLRSMVDELWERLEVCIYELPQDVCNELLRKR